MTFTICYIKYNWLLFRFAIVYFTLAASECCIKRLSLHLIVGIFVFLISIILRYIIFCSCGWEVSNKRWVMELQLAVNRCWRIPLVSDDHTCEEYGHKKNRWSRVSKFASQNTQQTRAPASHFNSLAVSLIGCRAMAKLWMSTLELREETKLLCTIHTTIYSPLSDAKSVVMRIYLKYLIL